MYKIMETTNRKTITDNLSKYCHLQKSDQTVIEVTQWSNSEGFDITLDDKIYSFTEGELEAMYLLSKIYFRETQE